MTIDKQLLDTLIQLTYLLVTVFLVVEVGDTTIKEMGYKKGMSFILGVTVPLTVLYYFVVEVGDFPPLLLSLIVVAVATLVGVGYYFMKKHHRKKLEINGD